MKKIIIPSILLLFFGFFSANSYAQHVDVQLIVFEPLPEVDLAAFLIDDNLGGAPRIMQILMTPQGVDVVMNISVSWKKTGSDSFQPIIWITTNSFPSLNLSNDQISEINSIDIETNESNGDLLDELRQLGRPAGSFEIEVEVMSPDGSTSTDSKIIEFSNPSQSFEILSPQSDSYETIGAVIASWTPVPDATFKILANVRENHSDSPEEALTSGNPIIDNADVGSQTTVNLQQFLSRDWLPGQEIVFQVTAVIPNPGRNEELNSAIINFYLDDGTGNQNSNNNVSPEQLLGEFTNSVINYYRDRQSDNSSDDSYQDFMQAAQQFFQDLQNGNVTFNDIRSMVDETGAAISEVEFRAIIEYLQNNPDALVSIKFFSN